jgi:hypothetical protein
MIEKNEWTRDAPTLLGVDFDVSVAVGTRVSFSDDPTRSDVMFHLRSLVLPAIAWAMLTPSLSLHAQIFTEFQQVLPQSPVADTRFGGAMACSGGDVLIGADIDDNANGINAGAVYVFRPGPSNSSWTQIQKLIADRPTTQFGSSIAMSSTRAVIGAKGGDTPGFAFVFEQQIDLSWSLSAVIEQPAALTNSDRFGYAVAIHRDWIVVTASGENSNTGAAYVYRRQGNGQWLLQQRIAAADGVPGDFFGHYQFEMSRDTIAIAAPFHPAPNGGIGAAYVFTLDCGVWTQTQRLTPSDAPSHSYFGSSLSVDGDRLAIGANTASGNGSPPGAVYIFERGRDGVDWSEAAILAPPSSAGYDAFGDSVLLRGNTLVAGATTANQQRGVTHYFARNEFSPSWRHVSELRGSNSAHGDQFGYGLAISGQTLCIGALYNDVAGGNSGCAYTFDLPGTSCITDVDDGSGTGTPSGGTGIEDLLYFLLRYDAGC